MISSATSNPSEAPSSASALATPAIPGADKIDTIRAKVLQTIREHMPIHTLFIPGLKINLDTFIKDQMLMRKIAAFIAPLAEKGPVDQKTVAAHFAGSELLAELKEMFKQNPDEYMEYLYDACCDVLNQKACPARLKEALEGRVFTLKNALVAQKTPGAIIASLLQNHLAPQKEASIVEEGAGFLRESLRIHLLALKGVEGASFREKLESVAEQLIPFVQNVTRKYLRENERTCPDYPLTFRNPTGYNTHGLVAATVMEACLNVLGYQTRLLNRSDLEPRVTLATAHSIVAVNAPDKSRFVIDPCYRQFHQDICLEGTKLPESPVLVLQEAEVDTYIDWSLMVTWKAVRGLFDIGQITVAKLKREDKLFAYAMDKIPDLKEIAPANQEAWVREALQRIWTLSTYSPVLSDQGFQNIFYGADAECHQTYESIQAMGIAPLTGHLSFPEVERRLGDLLKDPKLAGQNATAALALIAQLPAQKREKYVSLLDLDPRINSDKGMAPTLNTYFRSLKKIVNPEGKDLSVLYGCAGADCMSLLLATDANEITLADMTAVSLQEFQEALNRLQNPQNASQIAKQLENSEDFFLTQSRYGGSSSKYQGSGKHFMRDLALKLLFSLREMGVDLSRITLTPVEDGKGVRVDFPWQYHGAALPRKRSITYVTADITSPNTYPKLLQAKLKEGIDIFYMKAAFNAPKLYPQFLPQIAASINRGGWLMTADKTFTMEAVNPEPCLETNGLSFASVRNEEKDRLEKLILPPFDPLFEIVSLLRFPDQRHNRNPSSDLTYWTMLKLRQKQ